MREGFTGSADTFVIFWRAVMMFHINTDQGRIDLLRKLVARKKMVYHRDGPAELKGKNVGIIKRKDGNTHVD